MNNKIIKVMKNLDLKSIIKSFFCKKDKKSKLINLCGDIISKDIAPLKNAILHFKDQLFKKE